MISLRGGAFSVFSRASSNVASAFGPRRAQPSLALTAGGIDDERPVAERYDLLWAYYQQNGLYDDVTLALAVQGVSREALKPLRNPAYRVVEFYASKVWPGTLPDALPLEVDNGNPRLPAAIERVWRWSNWASQKQVFVRKAAALGDAFVRVAVTTNPDGTPLPDVARRRVYFQLIEPAHVTDLATDERGYLTLIRVDVPQATRDPATGTLRRTTHTEVWEKGGAGTPAGVDGRVRMWEHDRGDEPDLQKLGTPTSDRPLTDYGVSFVPFVHCLWRDVGAARGVGAYTTTVDKIDEANRMATRLHQLLARSNDEFWVLEGEGRVGADGRELPPPQIRGLAQSSTEDDGTVQVGTSRLARVPGGWKLTSKVPPLNYGAALDALNAHMRELERDLPELVYSRLQEEGGALSGRAVRFLLSGAVDRAIEARGNCEAALIRLQEMALTIGQVSAIPGFSSQEIGTYDAGNFAHAFARRDVLPADTLEDAQAELAQMQALTAKVGFVATAPPLLLAEAGYDAGQIAALLAERDARAAAAQAQQDQQAAANAPPLRLVRRVQRDAEGRIAAVVMEPDTAGHANTMPMSPAAHAANA